MRGFSMLFQRNWGKIRRIGRPAACNRDAAGNLSRNVAEKRGPFGITCSDGTMTESENTNGSRRWCGGRCMARLYSAGGAEALRGLTGWRLAGESLRGRLGARRPGRKRRGPAQPWRNVNPGRPVGTLDMGRQARSWREASAAADLHISMKCSDADAKGRRPGLFRRCFCAQVGGEGRVERLGEERARSPAPRNREPGASDEARSGRSSLSGPEGLNKADDLSGKDDRQQ